MGTPAFDTHKAIKMLTEAGADEPLAEAVVAAIGAAVSGELATKADLKNLEQTTKADLKNLEQATKAEISTLGQATKADLKNLDQATKSEIKALEQATKTEIKALEQHITNSLWRDVYRRHRHYNWRHGAAAAVTANKTKKTITLAGGG